MHVSRPITQLFLPPHFHDEDTDRDATIIHVVGFACLLGMCALLLYRIAAGQPRLLFSLALMVSLLLCSLILVRRGAIPWAGSLLLWTLLAFIMYFAWVNDGLHDTGLFAVPGLLVVAGLVLRRRYFYVITAATLAAVIFIGTMEIRGTLSNPFSAATRFSDVVDLAVIVGLVAVTVRLLTRNILATVHRARISEREARENAERSLRSETRYRLLFNSGNDAIMVHGFEANGLPSRFTEVNDIACSRLGYSRDALLTMSPLDIDAPDTVPNVAKVMQKLHAEKSAVWEGAHLTKDGRRIPVEISNHLFDDHGQEAALSTVRDITERKRSEEQLRNSLHEKEVLLREIHHRVKNNMQVISSLLSLESARVTDPATQQHFLDSMNRIHSMALVHEKLYRSGNLATIDFGEYLSSVTDYLLRSSHQGDITCTVDAEKISLSVDTAVPCGLIVQELVSNALKHAFRGRGQGAIMVKLSRKDAATVELAVQDDGVGFPPGLDIHSLQTMGMSLVVSLTTQIGGTVELNERGGTTFAVRFPA